MDLTLQGIVNAFVAMPTWEVLAVVLGITYVILAAKESLWAWVFAFFSTVIYTILFWEGALVSSSFLNLYYMIMAVYGFILWRGGENGEELEISIWGNRYILTVIFSGVLVSLVAGYISHTYVDAKHAYLDAFVMIFSIIATWMLAKKILQTWLMWIVIDSAAVVLYWKSGYHATIILFLLYVVLAFYGYASWRKACREC
jgi:nicotinamide mononucleotide transporter